MRNARRVCEHPVLFAPPVQDVPGPRTGGARFQCWRPCLETRCCDRRAEGTQALACCPGLVPRHPVGRARLAEPRRLKRGLALLQQPPLYPGAGPGARLAVTHAFAIRIPPPPLFCAWRGPGRPPRCRGQLRGAGCLPRGSQASCTTLPSACLRVWEARGGARFEPRRVTCHATDVWRVPLAMNGRGLITQKDVPLACLAMPAHAAARHTT